MSHKHFPRLLLIASLPIASCGGGNDDELPVDVAETTVVDVAMREFSLALARDSAPEGPVEFLVTNDSDEEHELLVIRTDLAPDELPTEDDGRYDEDSPGTELLAERTSIFPGEVDSLAVDLVESAYVLICNMFDVAGDEVEAHYALGERTAFTVGAPAGDDDIDTDANDDVDTGRDDDVDTDANDDSGRSGR